MRKSFNGLELEYLCNEAYSWEELVPDDFPKPSDIDEWKFIKEEVEYTSLEDEYQNLFNIFLHVPTNKYYGMSCTYSSYEGYTLSQYDELLEATPYETVVVKYKLVTNNGQNNEVLPD